jgi:hypothetical protein
MTGQKPSHATNKIGLGAYAKANQIAGARYARRLQSPAARRDLVGMSLREVFWAHFRNAA